MSFASSSLRPLKYKSWTQESLDAALAAVELDGTSLLSSMEFQVPHYKIT